MFAADPAVDGRIHVYEQWATAEDLDAHFQHPNYVAMRELLRGYPRVGSQTMKHRVDRVGPVYGPEGARRPRTGRSSDPTRYSHAASAHAFEPFDAYADLRERCPLYAES